jgi:predicted alpha/beta-hydrolase family hydrolase
MIPSREVEAVDSVAASQAALLLAAREGVLGLSEEEARGLELETAGVEFDLPALRPLARERRMRVEEATRPLRMSPEELRAEPPARVQEAMAGTVQRLYRAPDTATAAALFEAGMQSPHPLVRVASAAGARETTRLRNEIRGILHAEIDSPIPVVATLARAVMGQIREDDEALRAHVAPAPTPESRDRESSTAVLTHGTWAADETWYRPGGDFYTALAAARPDLQVYERSFTWSGAYTDVARRRAAAQLRRWIADEGLATPDLIAHSHGGTVAHLATRDGEELGRLVLLAWPVHPEWYPDPARVGRVVDVRVRLDLVIMADRGGQRMARAPFPVESHVNGWFDHTAVHDPGYWDAHGLWSVI